MVPVKENSDCSSSIAFMMLSEFGSSFLLVAASEFGDKTQLLAAALSIRNGQPGRVLVAATAASCVTNFLSAKTGNWARSVLGEHNINVVVTILFAILALATVVSAAKSSKLGPHRLLK